MSRNHVDFMVKQFGIVSSAAPFMAALLTSTGLILAQDPISITAQEPASIHHVRSFRLNPTRQSGVGLPIWRYQVTSPVNGASYHGYMVGTDPSIAGATTEVPVVLVPFIVQFTNTTTGFATTFDPSAAPDAGCTASQTAMRLIEDSPIFQKYPWTLNGVNVGVTQYIDAYQRSNFWNFVQAGNDYHVLLTYTIGEPLRLALSYSSPTLAAEIRTGVATTCANPGGSGSTNGAAYQGIVDFTLLEDAMTGYIASHHMTPDRFPIFILYNVMYSQNGLLYLGGYHFSEARYPEGLVSPGQTYAMANFRTNGMGPFDVSILSHEIGEWLDDPGGFNAVPLWGNIGEVSGCKRDLEIGDPLTRIDLPPIVASNGFAYHLQELAYTSWFFRTQSTAAGGQFSDNGTLTGDAGPVCH